MAVLGPVQTTTALALPAVTTVPCKHPKPGSEPVECVVGQYDPASVYHILCLARIDLCFTVHYGHCDTYLLDIKHTLVAQSLNATASAR